jgi:hypothetical protein
MTLILDPTDETVPVSRQITPRNGQVSGVVGLMDIRKPRGNILLDELERLMSDRMPDIEIRRFAKPTFTKPCPDDLRAQMKAECDFVIEALAD